MEIRKVAEGEHGFLHTSGSPETLVFVSVQVLRGVAAMMVVFNHLLDLTSQRLGAPKCSFILGQAGVDMFFCISGFIMVVTTAKHWGKTDFWRTFLAKRFVRILPLYWLLTFIKMTFMLALPSAILRSGVSVWYFVASMLLVPVWDPEHQTIFPLLLVGWTLSFEMFFYGLFAFGLARSRMPIIWAGLALAVAAAMSGFRNSSWPPVTVLLNPILLEFVYGLCLGYLTVRQWRMPKTLVFLALPAAFGIYALSMGQGTMPASRWFFWGVPGALVLASAISLEERVHQMLDGFPKLAGDASYSVYLTHGFFIVLVGAVMTHSHLHQTALWSATVILGLLVSLGGGLAVYRFVERPLTDLVNGFLPVK